MALTALSHFGFLMIRGRDAEAFLQGYTTCDLTRLDHVPALLGAICNIHGKVETTMIVSRITPSATLESETESQPAANETSLLLRMHRDSVKAVESFLAKYIVFSKAKMTDVSDNWHCYGTFQQQAISDTVDISIAAMANRREIWSRQPLAATGSLNTWVTEDIKAGILWIKPDTSDTYLPQSLDLDRLEGIDFDKGCYLGQEIIARVHFLGDTKKRLFTGSSDAPLDLHTKLSFENKTIGSILAAVQAEKGYFLLAQINSASSQIDVTAGDIHVTFARIG